MLRSGPKLLIKIYLDEMIADEIRELLPSLLLREKNITVSSLEIKPVGGGSINDTHQLTINKNQLFFLKSNKASQYPGLLAREKEGLEYLAQQHCIAVPSVIFCGTAKNEQMLLLEWIAPGPRTKRFWEKFGERLASLHQCGNEHYGFIADNYMGALPQKNPGMTGWTDFFITCRLLPQIELALQQHLLPATCVDLFQQLCKKLDTIFNQESPSLLHGDLWSGNFICNEQSEPVLIDPAVYYGHRSMDLGMTTLFGGFDRVFYDSYHYHWPLPENHREQWQISNLYPLLIHLNLFGQSYLGDIVKTLKKFT